MALDNKSSLHFSFPSGYSTLLFGLLC